MNSSEPPMGRPSPRRELQGPRPTPLKVNKDSYKIKKPPAHPTDNLPAAQPQARPPVIIYTVSPRIIHTNPTDFMSLVQRLTGQPRSPVAAALSPAARLALENPASSSSPVAADRNRNFHPPPAASAAVFDDVMDQIGVPDLPPGRPGPSIGILSPMPSSLPPISPGFFSPAVDPSSLSFLHELSPAFHGNRSYVENTFLASPNNFLLTPTVPSPNSFWDLFNGSFQDP